MHFLELSFWSIIPPLLTIFLVLKTRKILLSMAIGVGLGCLLIGKLNPIKALESFEHIFIGTTNTNGSFVAGSITTPNNLMVLLSMVMIGAMIGLLVKSGGSHAFAEYMAKHINSKKRSGLMTCIICTLLLIDDYFDNLTTGATMRAISDKNQVPREKLSYYIDSTVCSINSISPISSWAAFIAGLLATGMVTAFAGNLLFGYATVAVLMVVSIIIMKRISLHQPAVSINAGYAQSESFSVSEDQ